MSNLYPYQEEAVKFIQFRRGSAGLWMEMGTGKTRVALTYCARMQYEKVLIVCPISIASVWEDEVRKLGLDVSVLNLSYGSIQNRRDTLIKLSKIGRPTYVITNYEAFWRSPFKEAIYKWKPDSVILDEAQKIKGRTTRQAKFAHTLGANSVSRLALTGTPVTNGLEDLFSIYKFIDPRVFGSRYLDFQDQYLRMGGFQGYQIMGYRNEEDAARKVKLTAFQISKEEALDLPERTDVTVSVPLEPKSQAKYNEFKKNAIAEIEGEDEDGLPKRGVVLARIVLSSVLRLQQIANGFVTTDTGETVFLSDEKLKACQEITETALEQGQQVVVFCRFLKDLSRLSDIFPGSESIYGAIPQPERAARIARFKEGRTRVLICQIQVASLGIDLTAASIAVFFSTGFSLSDFVQAKDRLHRHGQTKKVTYYLLQARGTVDEKIYQALRDKVQIAAKVVDLDYAHNLLS